MVCKFTDRKQVFPPGFSTGVDSGGVLLFLISDLEISDFGIFDFRKHYIKNQPFPHQQSAIY